MRLLRITLFVLLDVLLLCGVAAAQDVSVRYQSQALSNRGLPLANQSVAVCIQPAVTTTQPCSPLATLATSTSTSSGGANPLTTDANGNFFFYAAPGKYTVQIYGPAVQSPFVQPDTVLSCSPTSNCTSSGASNFSSINNVVFADQQTGADLCAKIRTSIGLPQLSAGGTVDARGLQGAQSCSTRVTFSQPIRLLLGSTTISGPSSDTVDFVLSNGSTIIGLGSGNTKIQTPAGINTFAIVSAVPATDIRVEGVEIIGNGGGANQLCVQYQGVTRAYFINNYVHGCGAGNFGLDTNSPSQFSSDVWVQDNTFGPTLFSTSVGNVQVGPSAKRFHILRNNISETQSGQLAIDVDGANTFEIANNILIGAAGVAGGIQIEASNGSPVNFWSVHDNNLNNFPGVQGAIIATLTGAKTLSDGVIENNVLQVAGSIIVMDFNGSGGTIQRVRVSGNTINSSQIQFWHHQAGTFTDVQVTNNTGAIALTSTGGIYIHTDTGSINNALVSHNRITGGTGSASGLDITGTVNGLTIYGNDFTGNAGGEIVNTSNGTAAALKHNVLFSFDSPAQSANFGAAAAFTPPSSGTYQVSCYVVLTIAATTSSTLPQCVVAWTDVDTGTAPSLGVTATSTANTVGTIGTGVQIINAKSTGSINYSTLGYASVGATSMQYIFHLRIDPICLQSGGAC